MIIQTMVHMHVGQTGLQLQGLRLYEMHLSGGLQDCHGECYGLFQE